MIHPATVPESITAQMCARVFIGTIFWLQIFPRELVSYRDPRFAAEVYKPFSVLLEHNWRYQHMKTPRQMAGRDAQISFSHEYFKGTFRVSSCCWSNFLSTTRCIPWHSTYRFSLMAYAIYVYSPSCRVTVIQGEGPALTTTIWLSLITHRRECYQCRYNRHRRR